jgi:hypothetical protein
MTTDNKVSGKAKEREAWDDPIVAEVRAVRDKIAAQFDYDIDRIFDHVVAWGAERRKKEASKKKAPTSKTKAK